MRKQRKKVLKPWLDTLRKTKFRVGDYVQIIDEECFSVGRVWGADRCGSYRGKSRNYRLWILISEEQSMSTYVDVDKCRKITEAKWFMQRLKEGVQ